MLHNLVVWSAVSLGVSFAVFALYLEVYARMTGHVLHWRDTGPLTFIPTLSYIIVVCSGVTLTACGFLYLISVF